MRLLVQDIHGVMQLLSSMPAVNVELWSKLSRAAGAKGCWPQAMECATAALGALPKGAKIEEVVSAADVPEIAPPSWFWLSVAEMQHGQVSNTWQAHVAVVHARRYG